MPSYKSVMFPLSVGMGMSYWPDSPTRGNKPINTAVRARDESLNVLIMASSLQLADSALASRSEVPHSALRPAIDSAPPLARVVDSLLFLSIGTPIAADTSPTPDTSELVVPLSRSDP